MIREADKNKVLFFSGPAYKALLLPPSSLVATFFGGIFFRASKKVIFFLYDSMSDIRPYRSIHRGKIRFFFAFSHRICNFRPGRFNIGPGPAFVFGSISTSNLKKEIQTMTELDLNSAYVVFLC